VHPQVHRLTDQLPFLAFGWLGLGAIAAGFLRARRPGGLAALDRVFAAADTGELKSPSGG
jgi:hypothetical protein